MALQRASFRKRAVLGVALTTLICFATVLFLKSDQFGARILYSKSNDKTFNVNGVPGAVAAGSSDSAAQPQQPAVKPPSNALPQHIRPSPGWSAEPLPFEKRKHVQEDTLLKIRSRKPRAATPHSIPVLQISVLMDGERLLEKCIRSIDFPVDKLVIVWQGNSAHVRKELEDIRKFRPDMVVLHYPNQLGVAGGWNEAMRVDPHAPYWLLVSDDVRFEPGSLKLVAEWTYRNLQNSKSNIWFHYVTIGADKLHAAFVVTHRLARELGLYDENVFPAFCEDTDFEMRMNMWEVMHGMETWSTRDVMKTPDGKLIPLTHNNMPNGGGYVSGMSRNANSPRTDAETKRQFEKIRPLKGCNYANEKWGFLTTVPTKDQLTQLFRTPHNIPDIPLWLWRLDVNRRRCQLDGHDHCPYDWNLLKEKR